MTELAVLVPVLRRPHRVKPLLDSIKAATKMPHRVVFVCDPDDHEEQKAVLADGRAPLSLKVDGNYATKINVAVKATAEPFLFLGADDLHFHPGWYEAAKAKLRGGIGVVGINDLCNGRTATGDLATHSLVARWYAEELGTIDDPEKLLHEGYPHEWVDQEFTETAKFRGMFAHAPDSIVEHLHPMVGKAPMDDLYAAMPERMRAGRSIYRARRKLWT